MDTFWLLFGAIIVLIVWGVQYLTVRRHVHLTWPAWVGLVLGAVFLLFTIAWVATSIYEGEARAAGMGLLFFGVLTLIIAGLTYRKIFKDFRNHKT